MVTRDFAGNKLRCVVVVAQIRELGGDYVWNGETKGGVSLARTYSDGRSWWKLKLEDKGRSCWNGVWAVAFEIWGSFLMESMLMWFIIFLRSFGPKVLLKSEKNRKNIRVFSSWSLPKWRESIIFPLFSFLWLVRLAYLEWSLYFLASSYVVMIKWWGSTFFYHRERIRSS